MCIYIYIYFLHISIMIGTTEITLKGILDSINSNMTAIRTEFSDKFSEHDRIQRSHMEDIISRIDN